jgi:MoxR-like ATPase
LAELDPHAVIVVDRLRGEVIDPLKQRFVGRDEVVDLIALAVVSGEHLFLLGPPGTAKSAVIRGFAERVQGRYFEYLLTRFSEPNELFGPIARGDGGDGDGGDAARGRVRVPRRAVQRQ